MATEESKIDAWDKKISKKISDKTSKFPTFFSLLALSGNSQPWIILSVIFFVFDIFMERGVNILQLAVMGLSGLTTTIIKFIVKRKRPSDEMIKKYVAKGDYYSFPSGHSSRMACSAVILILFFHETPVVGVMFGLWALGVMLARISLKLHYFLDILGGAVVGSIIATVFYIFSEPLLNVINPLIAWVPTIF